MDILACSPAGYSLAGAAWGSGQSTDAPPGVAAVAGMMGRLFKRQTRDLYYLGQVGVVGRDIINCLTSEKSRTVIVFH